MGRGVAGIRDTVDQGSLLLTPGPHPRASPSASLPWAVIHRMCQEQGLAEWQAPRSTCSVHAPDQGDAMPTPSV